MLGEHALEEKMTSDELTSLQIRTWLAISLTIIGSFSAACMLNSASTVNVNQTTNTSRQFETKLMLSLGTYGKSTTIPTPCMGNCFRLEPDLLQFSSRFLRRSLRGQTNLVPHPARSHHRFFIGLQAQIFIAEGTRYNHSSSPSSLVCHHNPS